MHTHSSCCTHALLQHFFTKIGFQFAMMPFRKYFIITIVVRSHWAIEFSMS